MFQKMVQYVMIIFLTMIVSSFKKGKIDISLFINAYEEIKKDNIVTYIDYFTDEALKLAGFSEKDIENIRKQYNM